MQPAAVRASASKGLFESRETFFFYISGNKITFFVNAIQRWYILSYLVTAPFSCSQMANHSRQPNTTLALFSPFECMSRLTVFGIEAVAMVTLNALEIIIYLKERSLRKRDRYLVINQAVADMFVGGYVIFECWLF